MSEKEEGKSRGMQQPAGLLIPCLSLFAAYEKPVLMGCIDGGFPVCLSCSLPLAWFALKGEKTMETYKNLGGDSNINAYDIGDDSITVRFNDGGTYLYNYDSA